MTYLLDTHTLIWFLRSPASLPAMTRALIEDSAATLAISLATPWEMAIKVASGKLEAAGITAIRSTALLRPRRLNLAGAC